VISGLPILAAAIQSIFLPVFCISCGASASAFGGAVLGTICQSDRPCKAIERENLNKKQAVQKNPVGFLPSTLAFLPLAFCKPETAAHTE
jgi:hypothetical protein